MRVKQRDPKAWWTKQRRHCLRLDLDGVPVRAIAQVLGCSKSVVKKWRRNTIYRQVLTARLATMISTRRLRRYHQLDRLIDQLYVSASRAREHFVRYDDVEDEDVNLREHKRSFDLWIACLREIQKVAALHREEELRQVRPGDVILGR